MAEHKHKKTDGDKPTENEEGLPPQKFDQDESDSQLPLPSPENKSELHDQIETLSKALKEAQEKVDSYWDRLLRKEAELQNVQKKMPEELEKTRRSAIERFAGELIQVLDSFEHGMSFAEKGKAQVEDLIEGMKLTHSVLMNIFDKEGIQTIDPAEGEAFNPTYHEAISVQESKEIPPNRVLAVVQKGYMLNNRLLRPARVVVTRQSTQEGVDPNSQA